MTDHQTPQPPFRIDALWIRSIQRTGAILPAVLLALAGYERRWVAEDAFISLRVVKQILAGHGPVFNTGERVEAYTHPLWVAMLSIWGFAGLPLPQGAVILGLLLSICGLISAQAGAAGLAQHVRCASTSTTRWVSLPLGAVAFVAVPVVWDYVTSGLETGLSLAWLGASFWLLVRILDRTSRRKALQAAALIGLGPLVRPDLAIFSAGFLLALVVLVADGQPRRNSLPDVVLAAISAAALPVLYQVFRMGYFATLTPNTALAKEAGAARWSQGWAYLRDFIDPYSLWLPVLLLLGWWLWLMSRLSSGRDWRASAVLAAPVGSALVHMLYVVRVGGDFMHGRFLIPTLFGLLLPVMTVHVSPPARNLRAVVLAAMIVVVGVWAVVAAGWLRVPYQDGIGPDGIADERGVYAENSGNAHPVTLDDYVNMRQTWPRDGLGWRQRAEENTRVLIVEQQEFPLASGVDPLVQVVALGHNVGIAGYAAGLDVFVADQFGLADPLAGRALLNERGRPGHEKSLPNAWFIARFADLPVSGAESSDVSSARAALSCGDIHGLLMAVDSPLTASRFLSNIRDAWHFHHLRIPTDPAEARKQFCQ